MGTIFPPTPEGLLLQKKASDGDLVKSVTELARYDRMSYWVCGACEAVHRSLNKQSKQTEQ
jgi:hypothetical protein